MITNTHNITRSQRQIILYLFEFRFLYISHLQYFFNHKYSHRIKEWLIDLENKKHISIIKDSKDRTKPYIFCLAQKSRHIIKEEKEVGGNSLKWLYQEKLKSPRFIQKQLFLADCYVYFLKNKTKDSHINFFTQQDLKGYDYFPDPMPDVYIDEEGNNTNTRYFLDYFDENDSSKYMRFKIAKYFQYAEGNAWHENTYNAQFPSILLVFENERKKKHIYYYTKSKLQKSLLSLNIYLTSKNQIVFSKNNENIWEKI